MPVDRSTSVVQSGVEPRDLFLGSPFLLTQLGLHAATVPHAMKELTLVASGMTVHEIAQHAVCHALGELCHRQDLPAIDQLAEHLGVGTPRLQSMNLQCASSRLFSTLPTH